MLFNLKHNNSYYALYPYRIYRIGINCYYYCVCIVCGHTAYSVTTTEPATSHIRNSLLGVSTVIAHYRLCLAIKQITAPQISVAHELYPGNFLSPIVIGTVAASGGKLLSDSFRVALVSVCVCLTGRQMLPRVPLWP